MRISKKEKADFSSLRQGFCTLAEIWRLNGVVFCSTKGISLTGIPREKWQELLVSVRENEEMINNLVNGTGQRGSVSGQFEVLISVLGVEKNSKKHLEIAVLLIKGRGLVVKTLCVGTDDPNWKKRLNGFVLWDEIEIIIPAAEGNNQRALIGLVLQLAGIGLGRLKMIEAELPLEKEESAQLIKGADWLKSGLPRFLSASSEALYYLMRIRSVHARMIVERKQGYYTSMAVSSLRAAGMEFAEIASLTGLSEQLARRLKSVFKGEIEVAFLERLGAGFDDLFRENDLEQLSCAMMIWKGAAIYDRILQRKARMGERARRRLFDGDDLVSIASELRVSRRDLIGILSVKQGDLVTERDRFREGIVGPGFLRKILEGI